MKLSHPKGIAFVALVAMVSIVATLIVQARLTRNVESRGNPNPVIEWVVLQLSPKTPGNAGISVTIQGYNFTATGNEVRTRGQVLKTGLNAVDRLIIGDPSMPEKTQRMGSNPPGAKIITFELPTGIPCSLNEACPLSVVNANGTSNTVTFKLDLPL